MNESKKIEPTDAMVRAVELGHKLMRMDDRAILRVALNHPDAAGLFAADADARPWEPLAPGDPLHVGDEVRREWGGVSTRGTVGVQHSDLQVYTAGRRHLGHRGVGTWYVRRPVQELPATDGAVIIPAEGHEFIETNEGFANALVHLGGKWYGGAFPIKPEQITPGTRKEARA